MMNPSCVMCGESAKGNSIWPLGISTLHCIIAHGTWWSGHAGMPSVRRAHRLVPSYACRDQTHWKANVAYCDWETDEADL